MGSYYSRLSTSEPIASPRHTAVEMMPVGTARPQSPAPPSPQVLPASDLPPPRATVAAAGPNRRQQARQLVGQAFNGLQLVSSQQLTTPTDFFKNGMVLMGAGGVFYSLAKRLGHGVESAVTQEELDKAALEQLVVFAVAASFVAVGGVVAAGGAVAATGLPALISNAWQGATAATPLTDEENPLPAPPPDEPTVAAPAPNGPAAG